jgi:hypothetical protein
MGCRTMEDVMSVFNAYHGVSAADHQARFNDLLSKGYRIISLSVYGDPANASYAAVWVQRAGAAWQAFHGKSASDYQAFFDTWTALSAMCCSASSSSTSRRCRLSTMSRRLSGR